ncbi:SepM family pheromone-processing serine protease [Lacticaseibacillus pabuli]|uniref:endopeptidase La n=1 Tax=Lacticaseibacillus pabuli TaxID=3025672 RepID=A0ABY7WN39_9LACO|nr:SepM family pheromone-processing serine protease [Lacticaseibacillus sp. KACC 23028]WDF81632.1 SepM family pheromone-processing serine protease [Lacticaseibacillus sp. KACC 23028]
MGRKTNRKRFWGWLVAALLVFCLAVLAFFPTRYYIEYPGGADRVSKFIKVDGKRDKAAGEYRLMTVSVAGPASPIMLLWGKSQPFGDIVSEQDLMGDQTSSEYNTIQNYYIRSAGNAAIAAAFKAADKPIHIDYRGIYVMSMQANSDFRGKLKVGDTITAINGKHYQKAQRYIDAIKKHKVDTKVTVTYLRGKHAHSVTRKLVQIKGLKRAGLGIGLTDDTRVESKPHVKINAGEIGGPSAGLIFALQIYDQVSGTNLRAGRDIAGTGTIDDHGKIGAIGGIDKKVYAASKAGATIFFAPDIPATKTMKREDPSYINNYVEAKNAARKMKTKMKIVPVRKLQDAIQYLQAK